MRPVMRRRSDDWINATHILKAAGFDKPARTRILEREVQKETHEKVQGGYGKYQGTCFRKTPSWIKSDFFQVPGSRWSREKLWRSEIMSTRSCVPSSSLRPATSAPLLLRSIRRPNQSYPRSPPSPNLRRVSGMRVRGLRRQC